ncbi:hypothetical protein THAOC_09513, partial [Thalassiosira oceanica]
CTALLTGGEDEQLRMSTGSSADRSASKAWKDSLNSTCNRLLTHYANLLKAASLDARDNSDPRSGGGLQTEADNPPPPLAENVEMSAVQAKLAAENICVATSNLLDLIRTLRLSVLLMDEEAIQGEEEEMALELCEQTIDAERDCLVLESKLMGIRDEEIQTKVK